MKKIIFKQFYFEFLKNFLTFLFVLSIIVWTLQAVNYFDFVTDDGHGLKIYFYYAILNFPKIIHRLVPFVFFVSLFYTIISYEKKNELNIFWQHGIKKNHLVNKTLILTILLVIFQILIGTFVVPKSQFLARQFLKSSSIEFFTTLIKPGRFLNITKDLTIYIEKENKDKSFENIFLEDKRQKSRLIYAKKGQIIDNDDMRIFKLINGNVVENTNPKIKIFKFDQINLDMTEIKSNTITTPKIQEIDTINLLLCLLKNKSDLINFNCNEKIKLDIKQEIFKRLLQPFYLILISLICGFLLIKSRISNAYSKYQIYIFITGFMILLFSEASVKYVSYTNFSIFFTTMAPIILFIIIYFIFLKRISYV